MGSRGRSIRLRIYFLVAIPLVTMLGLFGYVAYTSVTNYQNLDRAPSLIQATSVPMSSFMDTLQAERRAAFVYLVAPTAANKSLYEAAITATDSMDTSPGGPHGLGFLTQALDAPATKQSATPDESAAITKFLGAVTGSQLQNLRAGVTASAIPAITAFQDYTTLIDAIPGVFQAEAASLTDAGAATQGLGLIETVLAREEISQQDTLLAGALASGTLTTDERVGFVQAAGRELDDEALFPHTLNGTETAAFNDGFNTYDGGAAAPLDKVRIQVQQGVEAGSPLAALEAKGLNSATWQHMNNTIALANFQGGTAAADASLAHDQGIANSAHRTVYITGAIGALGLILSLILTIVLARSINRRLTRLRRQALLLAQEHLPSVVSRLRRGESVDVAAEAPPLRVGGDEIGQVGQAFDAVRQTAIASAVEEARLRQGVNDVFRNLARRNQSLLQRQLTSLDQMERRTTDPEVLDDLFKLDHLTTRMRRHAEGLIILSGAPPGRGWSAPVRIIDVLRGAASEVEDYARVQASTQSKAALSGSAVTDVIHLLAELIENATSLSPPYTQVRVSGEPAGNGFAIEIEDRGLGMKRERLAELNDRLMNPPDVNPHNTEQLGLFVVGQLARRHGIQVTLRTSPFGGTSAVVLIPRRLVVDEAPAALSSGENPMLATGSPDPALSPFSLSAAGNGNGSGTGNGRAGGNGHAGGNRHASGQPGAGARNGSGSYSSGQYSSGQYSSDQYSSGQNGASQYATNHYSSGQNGASQYSTGQYSTSQYSDGGHGNGAGSPPDLDTIHIDHGFMSGTRRSGGYPQVGPPVTAGQPAAGNGSQRGRHSDEIPVVTGIPVSRDAAPPFNVFTPVSRAGDGYGPDVNDPESGRITSYQDAAYGNIGVSGEGYDSGGIDGGEHQGLPRRVRQASLAPQLRDSTVGRPGVGGPGQAGAPPASAASLSDMRTTLSAMQRGWQQGRSQSAQPDTEGNPNGA
ncbi:MAG: ATP-binding protein [Actinomycetia bacterium]|nr:ATP-binding protein [Actinomycetes bacterium]